MPRPTAREPGERVPSRSASQILEAILSLPQGAELELRAPVFPVYGEELEFVFTEVRKKGCRRLIIDGKTVDLSAEVSIDEAKVKNMDAVVDRVVIGAKHEKAIKAAIAATLLVGDGLMQAHVVKGAGKAETDRFYKGLCSATHHFVYGGIEPRVLHVQQSRERLPHLRRPGGPQDHPSGTARARPDAQHRDRMFRQGSVQVQPGHVGWPRDVHPCEDPGFLARHARGRSCRSACATSSSMASRRN